MRYPIGTLSSHNSPAVRRGPNHSGPGLSLGLRRRIGASDSELPGCITGTRASCPDLDRERRSLRVGKDELLA